MEICPRGCKSPLPLSFLHVGFSSFACVTLLGLGFVEVIVGLVLNEQKMQNKKENELKDCWYCEVKLARLGWVFAWTACVKMWCFGSD